MTLDNGFSQCSFLCEKVGGTREGVTFPVTRVGLTCDIKREGS